MVILSILWWCMATADKTCEQRLFVPSFVMSCHSSVTLLYCLNCSAIVRGQADGAYKFRPVFGHVVSFLLDEADQVVRALLGIIGNFE